MPLRIGEFANRLGGVGLGGKVGARQNEFFLDATSGNDSNPGTRGAPWQTIEKVNGITLKPGDTVLFKCGETWTGTKLTVAQSGASGAPITYRAYGTGAAPILDGNNAVNCMQDSGAVSYITVQDIEVTRGSAFGIQFQGGGHDILIDTCTAHDCGNDNFNFMSAVYSSAIRNCTSYTPYDNTGGTAQITCLEIADGCHDILVDACTLYDSPQDGLAIHSHAATRVPYNITVQNCTIYDVDGQGVHLKKQDGTTDTDRNIRFSNCVIRDSVPLGSYGVILEQTGGKHFNGVTFDQCRIYGINGRPVYLTSPATFTRCLLAGFYGSRCEGTNAGTFLNNTFYREAVVCFDTQADASNIIAKNNIFCVNDYGAIIRLIGTTGLDFDYNFYFGLSNLATGTLWEWGVAETAYNWANWKSTTGMDAHSPTPEDPPGFVDVAGKDWTLAANSPAIDKGTDVGFSYLGAAPDCGYAEKA